MSAPVVTPDRLVRVVLSCTTPAQLQAARRYLLLSGTQSPAVWQIFIEHARRVGWRAARGVEPC